MKVTYLSQGKFEIEKTETITTKLEKTTNDIKQDIANLEKQKASIQNQIDELNSMLSEVLKKSEEKEVKDKIAQELTIN